MKFGLTEDDVNTIEGKQRYISKWGLTVREILQLEGTEATRYVYGNNFWVKHVEQKLSEMKKSGIGKVVISDVRFDNEADAVRLAGGKVIKLIRPAAALVPNHASEAGVTHYLVDTIINNDGSIQLLEDELQSWMSKVYG